MTSMNSAARDVIRSLTATAGGVRKDSDRAVAYVSSSSSLPSSAKLFARLSAQMKAPSRTAVGLVAVETMRRHPDSLSVTGVWLRSTDRYAPHVECAWVLAGPDGSADVEHLCRDGGRCAQILDGVL